MTTRGENANLNSLLADDAVYIIALLILGSQVCEISVLRLQPIRAFRAFVAPVIEDLESSLIELDVKLLFVRCDRVGDMLKLPVILQPLVHGSSEQLLLFLHLKQSLALLRHDRLNTA